MSKLSDRPTNEQFMQAPLIDLGEWFKRHDIKSMLGITCIYCGKGAIETDHVIPKSRGGSNKKSNLVPACVGCNAEKGTRTPKEWIGVNDSEIYFGSQRHLEHARARMEKLQ